jgi:hypothetical protein
MDLRYRQIHLDYHIPADIPDLAVDFDAEKFADTIVAAHIDSVTCFARCHNGWLYYESSRFPERVHPQLKHRNLLGEQIDVLHSRGVRAPIYITVQWDHFTAQRHLDWCVVRPDGCIDGNGPLEPGFYRFLCLNHDPYIEFLQEHVREVLEMFPTDGIFFDILWTRECVCDLCKGDMLRKGLNPFNEIDRKKHATEVMNRFLLEMSDFVRSINPDCSIYYNSGDIRPGNRSQSPAFSHFEFDALPSGSCGGYLAFPTIARFARNLGRPCMGMTGKFHRGWGDVHSLKNQAALEYECFQLLALSCRCSVGDQMHPNGVLENPTYELIGKVYAEVEKKEPWCRDAKPLTDIALLSAEEFGPWQSSVSGMVRMLTEGGHQFDIIDSKMNFKPFKVIILPDYVTINPILADKLREYIKTGGSVLASFESGVAPDNRIITFPELGIRSLGPGVLAPDGKPARGRLFSEHWDWCDTTHADFIRPRQEISADVPAGDMVMYTKAVEVEAITGSTVLADVILPYYDRTFEHFTSHQQSPTSGRIGSAGVVQNGNVIYFAHAIGALYTEFAPRWVRTIFLNALARLLPSPLLRHNGPSAMETAIHQQDGRRVVHLLYYVPERRTSRFEIVEDVIPLYNIKISLREDTPVTQVRLVPECTELEFTREDDRLVVTVPVIRGHAMLEIV